MNIRIYHRRQGTEIFLTTYKFMQAKPSLDRMIVLVEPWSMEIIT